MSEVTSRPVTYNARCDRCKAPHSATFPAGLGPGTHEITSRCGCGHVLHFRMTVPKR